MRYFISTDSDNKPDGLYRFDSVDTFIEQTWTGSEWVEDKAGRISRMLCTGDGWYDEVPIEVARQHFPGSC